MPPSSASVPPSDAARGEAREVDQPTLSRLTGVRSGKQSYYAELRRTEARMTSAVQALEGISAALVRIRDDPRALLEEVLRAAAGHLRAAWTMIALRDGELPALSMRFLAVGPDGEVIETVRELPPWLGRELAKVRGALDTAPTTGAGWVRVPMTLDGAVLGRLDRALRPPARHRRARRPVGAPHPGRPGGGVDAHRDAVRDRRRPAPQGPADVRRDRAQLAGPGDPHGRAGTGRAAAARAAPAGAAGRRTAPDRARIARQRGPVCAVGGAGGRGVPGRGGRPGRRRQRAAADRRA